MPNYTVMAAEIRTDPLTAQSAAGWNTGSGILRPYAQLTNAEIADKINSMNTGRTQKRGDVSGAEILAVVDMTDLTALPTNPNNTQLSQERRDLSWLESVFSTFNLRLLNDDGTPTQVRGNLQRIFPAGTGSRTRLLALETRPTSRGAELNIGGTVTAQDVAIAKAEP